MAYIRHHLVLQGDAPYTPPDRLGVTVTEAPFILPELKETTLEYRLWRRSEADLGLSYPVWVRTLVEWELKYGINLTRVIAELALQYAIWKRGSRHLELPYWVWRRTEREAGLEYDVVAQLPRPQR